MPYAKKLKTGYTYADYCSWPDEERWEIIDGTAYDMSPAPGVRHQNVVGTFFTHLKQALSDKSCRPFIAPTDVVLSESDVVQPDIFVVCDEKKITEANIQGAPRVVIEVLSPATALKDKREKKALYERFGVREYVLVDPVDLYLERFLLKRRRYGTADIFGAGDEFAFKTLEDLTVALREVFEVEAEGPKRRPGEK